MNKKRFIQVWKPVSELTPDEYRKCHRLNFRTGGMDGWLETARKKGLDASASMILEKDGKLVGWGLMFPRDGEYSREKRKTIYLYVRVKDRKKGFGQELLKDLKKHTPYKPYVCPHDKKSAGLYKKFNKETKPYPGYSYRDIGEYE